jgi:hypothetical protein
MVQCYITRHRRAEIWFPGKIYLFSGYGEPATGAGQVRILEIYCEKTLFVGDKDELSSEAAMGRGAAQRSVLLVNEHKRQVRASNGRVARPNPLVKLIKD